MKYGKSTTTNVAISPQFLTKMVNDSDLEDEYIKEIGNMKKLDEQFAKQQADIGWRVEQGWAIVLFCKLNDAPVVTLNDAITV